MNKYSFSPAQRYAVFLTHGEKCYLHHGLIDFTSMEVDHVIPESLLADPAQLAEVLKLLGRPANFSLNSYANWMPACGPCNRLKLATIFEPTPLIQLVLQKAAQKSNEAELREKEIVTKRKVKNALITLQRATFDSPLDDDVIEALKPLIDYHIQHRQPGLVAEPIRLTPLYEVLSEDNGIRVVRGPYGIGVRPATPHAHSSFNCPNCGSIGAWNGVRCVICGMQDDD